MPSDAYLFNGRTLAILSGKGGTGKTMILAAAACALAEAGVKVRLVDTDFATGGLSYYMGVKYVENLSVGLVDMLRSEETPDAEFGKLKERGLVQVAAIHRVKEPVSFVGVGDHRALLRRNDLGALFRDRLPQCVRALADPEGVTLFDCRGGIDDESLAVCGAVDELLLIVETDTTSFRATQYLVDVLAEHDMGHKLKGFIINKAIDNPAVIGRNGTAVFGCRYLGAVPFDFKAIRSFLVGEIPASNSLFMDQVIGALRKLYADRVPLPAVRGIDDTAFAEISTADRRSTLGGMVLCLGILSASAIAALLILNKDIAFDPRWVAVTGAIGILGIAAALDPIRKSAGDLMEMYVRAVRRVLEK